MVIPQISIDNAIIDEEIQSKNALELNECNTELIMKKIISQQLQQPPIITHTGPTPIQTPSNSSCNSPSPHEKFIHSTKIDVKKSLRRTRSLDAASDQITKVEDSCYTHKTSLFIFNFGFSENLLKIKYQIH